MSQSKPKQLDETTVETLNDTSSDENTPLIETSKPKYNKNLILISLWVNVFLASMDGTIVANIMGPIAAGFEQENLKQWIATSYLLTNSACAPLYGKLSDIIGRRNSLMIAQFFFGIGCFSCAFTNSVPQFAFARSIMGIGGAGAAVCTSVIMSDILTLEERGLYQGFLNLVYAFGAVTGAPLGSWALETIGWRWSFGVQGPMILCCIILTYININIKPKHEFAWKHFERLDIGGSITLVGFICSFLLIFSSEIDNRLLFILMTVSLSLFIYNEKYIAKEQILPISLFKGELGGILIVSFLALFTMSCLTFGLPTFLQVVQDQTVRQSASYLTVVSFPVSFGSLGSGYIVRHYKGANIRLFTKKFSFISFTVLALVFTLVECVYIIPSPYDPSSIWRVALVVGLIFFGFGYGSILVTTLITMVDIAGPEGQAAATGLNFLFRSLGLVLGAGLSLSTYETYLSNNLSKLLVNVNHGGEILENLLHDARYLKTSKYIDNSLRWDILTIYQGAMYVSFSLAVLAGYICSTVAFVSLFAKRTARTTTPAS